MDARVTPAAHGLCRRRRVTDSPETFGEILWDHFCGVASFFAHLARGVTAPLASLFDAGPLERAKVVQPQPLRPFLRHHLERHRGLAATRCRRGSHANRLSGERAGARPERELLRTREGQFASSEA